ncbi:hypothetical protein A3860_07840 [Niastella vici]|uniref:Uncharacterized protein n=1 Tax=Niastella vici TaxID=1703345 RepID=A0A1V9FIX5_9BACT|nr:hypothetical protein A3860_07840 [Niastella vici]
MIYLHLFGRHRLFYNKFIGGCSGDGGFLYLICLPNAGVSWRQGGRSPMEALPPIEWLVNYTKVVMDVVEPVR